MNKGEAASRAIALRFKRRFIDKHHLLWCITTLLISQLTGIIMRKQQQIIEKVTPVCKVLSDDAELLTSILEKAVRCHGGLPGKIIALLGGLVSLPETLKSIALGLNKLPTPEILEIVVTELLSLQQVGKLKRVQSVPSLISRLLKELDPVGTMVYPSTWCELANPEQLRLAKTISDAVGRIVSWAATSKRPSSKVFSNHFLHYVNLAMDALLLPDFERDLQHSIVALARHHEIKSVHEAGTLGQRHRKLPGYLEAHGVQMTRSGFPAIKSLIKLDAQLSFIWNVLAGSKGDVPVAYSRKTLAQAFPDAGNAGHLTFCRDLVNDYNGRLKDIQPEGMFMSINTREPTDLVELVCLLVSQEELPPNLFITPRSIPTKLDVCETYQIHLCLHKHQWCSVNLGGEELSFQIFDWVKKKESYRTLCNSDDFKSIAEGFLSFPKDSIIEEFPITGLAHHLLQMVLEEKGYTVKRHAGYYKGQVAQSPYLPLASLMSRFKGEFELKQSSLAMYVRFQAKYHGAYIVMNGSECRNEPALMGSTGRTAFKSFDILLAAPSERPLDLMPIRFALSRKLRECFRLWARLFLTTRGRCRSGSSAEKLQHFLQAQAPQSSKTIFQEVARYYAPEKATSFT